MVKLVSKHFIICKIMSEFNYKFLIEKILHHIFFIRTIIKIII